MKLIQIIILSLFVTGNLFAQQFDARIAETRTPIESIDLAEMPALDNEELLQAELERRGPGIAPRFAEVIDVDINPDIRGTWEELSDGTSVWRMRIKSENAKSLNLGFTKFYMPAGGSLILFSPDKKKVMGPFTPADNEEHEQLWTPIFEGDELIVEVQLPTNRKSELDLELSTVNHDFLGFSSIMSGSCNLDVICGADDGWGIVDNYRDIIQSVAVYGQGGSTYCTGFLVNNTRNDCTPLFMTADHCMNPGDAPTLVVYWNYFNSVCRQPGTGASGGPGDGDLTDFNTGAIYRAHYNPSDVMLVELDDDVSETANAFFAGWSAEMTLPGADTLIAIHHPSTDEKRISFEFDAPHLGEWGSGAAEIPDGDHVIIPDWDIGTTEGGSSGSPVFDGNKRVIGQLHGGQAACGNDAYDSYGWFAISWEGGGTPNSRLKDWLDPDDTGVLVMDGRDQAVCSFAVIVDNPTVDICASTDASFGLNISEAFTEDVTLSIEGLPDGATAEFSSNPAAPASALTLTISNTDGVATGEYPVTITGTGGGQTVTSTIYLNVFAGIPEAATLLEPENNFDGTTLSPPFSWAPVTGAETYSFVLASDPDFNNIITQVDNLTDSDLMTALLEPETTYYWMVTGYNICGEGTASEMFSFSTAAISCGQLTAQDLPIEISTSGEVTITSEIEINLQGNITDVRIDNLSIAHTYVGDLTAELTSPEGTVITLFERPGVPASFYGCNGDNIEVNLYDTAPNTSDDFENSCEADPAISGDYQPVNAFNSFANESATGTWTLTIIDAFNQDGGALNDWNITICTAIPDEAALIVSEDSYQSCLGESITFDVLAGTGFDADVTLSAENLPDGAEISFSENPVAPGASTTVTLSGATNAGMYAISIIGNDGNSMSSIPINIDLEGAPAAAGILSPADGNIDEPTGLTLSWEDISEATGYIVTVASDPDFNNIVVSNALTSTSFNLSGLDNGTTYYWEVQTIGECGTTDPAATFSFTTIPDLNISFGPEIESACLADEIVFQFEVAPGFSAPVGVSHVISSGDDFTVNYSVDPNNVTPGESITATLYGFAVYTSETFDITFTFSDGVYESSVSASITLELAPDLPVQTFPANGADFMDPNISLLWDGAVNAENYLVEVSDSDLFENIVESATVTGTLYSLTNISQPGIYYWRVTALNECGGSITSPLTFTFSPNSTQDLDGKQVMISPNPTSGAVSIELSTEVDERVIIQVFNIDGKVLQTQFIDKGQSTASFSLDAYPAGVYLVKMTEGNARLTRRVILQK